jgi:hypothetical protein
MSIDTCKYLFWQASLAIPIDSLSSRMILNTNGVLLCAMSGRMMATAFRTSLGFKCYVYLGR